MRQVIIGNGAAGISATKAIREIDSSCSITLVSAEKCNAYSPMLLRQYLKGAIERQELFAASSDFYETRDVERILGRRATAVNPLRRTVHLEGGRELEYDNLLVATGASTVSLSSPAKTPPNALSPTTIGDVDKVAAYAKTAKRVVIIGAGLVGLETANALLSEEVDFTILESSGQVLSQDVDADCAAIVQKKVESHGVSVLLGKDVGEVKGDGRRVAVVSHSGEEWTADMALIATGPKPNTSLLRGSGIGTNWGIPVDEHMRTNVGNVFAAGDVAEVENAVTAKKELSSGWSNASRQGRIAGLNMAGHEESYEGGLRTSMAIMFGLTLAVIGLGKAAHGGGLTESLFCDRARKIYRRILLDGGRIVGATLLERTEDAGVLKSLMLNRKDISAWQGDLARDPPNLRKLLQMVPH
jgi:NAD(P)H-nitrite reductase large subunit